MRDKVLSALLILTMATSASACVVGSGNSLSNGCIRSARAACERQLQAAHPGRCGPVLKAAPAHCDIRGLVQFQVAAFTKCEVPSPLRLVTAQVSVSSDPALRNSSIGSPETDRGPPLS